MPLKGMYMPFSSLFLFSSRLQVKEKLSHVLGPRNRNQMFGDGEPPQQPWPAYLITQRKR